jgi:tetratricopeptide (TPR) repeat protein
LALRVLMQSPVYDKPMREGILVAERFLIGPRVGSGGMGAIYRAHDRLENAPVAFKVLALGGESARFEREIQTLAELRDAAIVRYVAHGTHETASWLATEWLEGEDLATRLQRSRLEVGETLALAERISGALAFAHDRGVIHRDVKPANIFLPDGVPSQAKLLDFGIARVRDVASFTRTGAIIGTPGYMAPEQASAAPLIGPPADLFGLGCVLYQCLTGRPPFEADQLMALLAKIIFEEVPPPSELCAAVPHELDSLVARLLAKDAADRPADGASLLRELREVAAGSSHGSLRQAGLGRGEQRFITVILAGQVSEDAVTGGRDTVALSPLDHATVGGKRMEVALAVFTPRVAKLRDGAFACLLSSIATTDQARQAVRAALALKRQQPNLPVVVASGQAQLHAIHPVGQAIDHASRLLQAPRGADLPAEAVRVDNLTASMLGSGFTLGGDAQSLAVLGEQPAIDAPPPLLGRTTPCVGRDKEIGYLEALFAECQDERAVRLALVTGAAGTGKSRLRQELFSRIRANAEIWIARGDPLAAGSPLGMLARVLASAVGLRDGEPKELSAQKLRARVAQHQAAADVARVTAFLGEIVGVPCPDDDVPQLRAARADPRLMSSQTLAAWLAFIEGEASARPIALVLEDLHWGDRPTIEYVLQARTIKRAALVLALARPEIHLTFPALRRETNLHEIRLTGLGTGAAERLVRSVLPDLDAAIRERLVEQAEGNAFYLEELIRAQASGGGVAAASVVAMLQARLEALDHEERRLLRAASIVGEASWRGAIAALLGAPAGPDLDERIEALVERELIGRNAVARFVGEQEIAFRHALVREAAYATLTEEDRALGHRLAGAWLEAAGERDALTLAQHFQRGGESERAAHWYAQAAEQALAGNDLDAALARARTGLGFAPSDATLGALLLVVASVHDWRGENALAFEHGREAMRHLTKDSPAWHRAACSAGVASRRMGDREGLRAVGQELISPGVLEKPDNIAVACAARVLVQLVVVQLGELAHALIDRISRFEANLDPLTRSWLVSGRAMAALFDGDASLFIRDGDAIIAAADLSGDIRTACNLRFYVGVTAQTTGDYQLGESRLRAGLAIAEPAGLPTMATILKKELGFTLLAMGRIDEARLLGDAALRETQEQRDRFQECTAHELVAHVMRIDGRLDEAETEARLACAVSESAPPFRLRALTCLANVLLARGNRQEALAVARRAQTFKVMVPKLFGRGAADLVLAESLRACGEDWIGVVRAAYAELVQTAAGFADPRLREPFLATIPEHRRLFELLQAT